MLESSVWLVKSFQAAPRSRERCGDGSQENATSFMKGVETVLIQLGTAADKLTIVTSEPAYVAEPKIVLRLAQPGPSVGQPLQPPTLSRHASPNRSS